MPASEWYRRQKSKIKRALRTESRGSLSLSNQSHASAFPGPSPRLAVNPANERLEPSTSIVSTGSATAIERSSQRSSYRHVKSMASSTAPTQNPGDHAQSLTAATTAVVVPELLPENTPKAEKREKKISWSGLESLLGVLKSGAGAFGPLKMAIESLENSIGTFERASRARDDYQELGTKLDQLLGDLAEFSSDWLGRAMTTSVKNLCSGIEAELKVVGDKQGRNAPERYIAAIDDSDAVLECYRRIHGHVERLMLNANLNMWRIIDEEMTDRRLLQLSPTMSGAYNSWASSRTKRRRCTEGTRIKELDKLKTWASDPSTEPICWIDGMAGTGKTTIAYTLCADLDTANELGASFFFTRMIPECRNIQLMIPSIAYQLAQFSYPFRHALYKALESDQVAHTRELKLQFHSLIVNPLKAVQRTLPSGLVVVIDALDECDDSDSIGEILDLLISFDPNLPVRFLVSSRPEPNVYRRMMESPSEEKLVLHDLDITDMQHDIEVYLRHELHDVPLTTEQWDPLLKRCGVLFIYASTACRYIKTSNETMGYEEALDMVLRSSSEGTTDIEKELDKLYLAALEAAFKSPRVSEADKKRMKIILDTIICARWPLTTVVLAGLLGLKNAEHASILLRPLFSVVNLLGQIGFVAPLHPSFSEFMLSPTRSASFHCEATNHHIALTQACLQQIRANPVQFNLCGIETSYLFDEEIPDLHERSRDAISPALFYACCDWTYHLELSGQAEDLRNPVQDFLSARLLLWMEVMSLKGCIWREELRIKQVEKWCREALMSKEIIELAHDAVDFVSSYANSPTNKSTPHIYTSMLPFWPSTSPIAKHYIPRTAGILQPEGSALERLYLPLIAHRYLSEAMQSAVYSPDGSQIVAAVGNDIFILDGWTGQTVLGPLEGHTDLVTSVAVSPNGLRIASGSDDATIRVWGTKNGKLITGPFRAHRYGVRSVAFSPDSTRIVSASGSGPFRVWSAEKGELILSSKSENKCAGHVRTAVFSFDGTHVISGDSNNTVCFWDAQTGKLVSELPEGHSKPINSVALSSDGSQIISTSGGDSTICVWDAATQEMIMKQQRDHICGVNQAFLSPNNMFIAYCDDLMIDLWHTSGKATIIPNKHRGDINSVAFSPDSSRLVSCSEDGIICIWSVEHIISNDGTPWETYGIARSVCFSSDSSQIVTGTANGRIYQWDAYSGALVAGPLLGHCGYICSVAISPDRAYIASASSDKTIRLWDMKSGNGAYRVLETHTKRPDSLQFTPDNSYLIYGSSTYFIANSPAIPDATSTIQVKGRDEWAAEVPRTFMILQGYLRGRYHLDDLCCVAHSPDGLYTASGSTQGTLRLWCTRNGQLILNLLSGHVHAISRIVFSPDGTRLLTCSNDQEMRFWTIPGKSTRKVMNSNFSDTYEETGVATNPDSHWKLCEDGWIINERKELLTWLPYEFRSRLLLPENDLLISHRGSLKIDFTGRNIGRLWTECYHPASPSTYYV